MGLKGAMSELLSVLAASVANVNGASVAKEEASDNAQSTAHKLVQAGASRLH
jgi:hypothetical protein